MKLLPFDQLKKTKVSEIGGKARALLQLLNAGFQIPQSFCLPVRCYEDFINENKLSGRIQLELNRKDLSECRWEELWDTALRIRNCFLKCRISSRIRESLKTFMDAVPPGTRLAVRSSSTVEDSAKQSFAGLHESYLGIKTLEELEQKIILVWASLWSDAALAYRKELQLSVADSKMAVVIQTMLNGESSGIAFSQSPLNDSQSVIEAVYGLNQGLVDGRVQPDRWFLERKSGKVITHQKSERHEKMVEEEGNQVLIPTTPGEKKKAPLDKKGIQRIFSLCCRAEKHFGKPQDIEWTLMEKHPFLLQSRPITTKSRPDPKENRRDWDLSLKRSFENLLQLQKQIKKILKKMTQQADSLARQKIADSSNPELIEIMQQRQNTLQYWTDVYWEVFIPYAHGMRLFGQIYNEKVCPDDPFEFVELLQNKANLATRRNNEMLKLAAAIENDPQSRKAVQHGEYEKISAPVQEQLKLLVKDFAMPGELLKPNSDNEFCRNFFAFVTSDFKTTQLQTGTETDKLQKLEHNFLKKFHGPADKKRARKLLELGRHSMLMRDDDNVYLNRFKQAVEDAASEMRRRLGPSVGSDIDNYSVADLIEGLKQPGKIPGKADCRKSKKPVKEQCGRRRQLVGQPAGPGFARGVARVVSSNADLFAIKKGEIIVCDAIGPEMTFAVPLAGGIIERRGGMLIHGAIIAREYGIPCVTGISEAMVAIRGGETLSIDGHLGLVTIERKI